MVSTKYFWRICCLLPLGLAGCTTVPSDLGRADVDALIAERGWSVPTQGPRLDALLTEPLTPDAAIQVVLINNPGLQASLARLGFGAADVYAAGRLSNPSFSAGWLDSDAVGEGTQRTLGVALPFADLLTLPARAGMAKAEFAALKSSVAGEVIATLTDAEIAFYRHVADRRVQDIRVRRATAAALAVELAARFHAAGNINDRELAEQRAAAAEAQLERLEGAARVQASRARLAALLGLSTAGGWQVELALAAPPEQERPLAELEALARQQRLDLVAARAEADVLAQRLGVTRWSRWLGDIELGYERERETDGARLRGPTVDLEIPLFNQHRDDLLVAEATLGQAVAGLTALTLEVENGVRLAYAGVNNARARVAVYRDNLIPAQADVVARTQEQVNFMLTGVFELLDVKRDELAAQEGYLQSVSDYWIARAELGRAVGARQPAAVGEPVEMESPSEDAGHEHHHNHGGSP